MVNVNSAAATEWIGRYSPKLLGSIFAKVVDRAEQILVATLFSWLWWRMLPKDGESIPLYVLALLVSEGTVLLFILIRRPTTKVTVKPREWAIAFGGTLGPFLIVDGSSLFLPQLGLALLVVGWGIHTWAKLTLRRSFGVIAADRGIKTVGPYGFVRHPMYFGYMVSHVGFVVAAPSMWNCLVYTITWSLLLSRIAAEERMLSQSFLYESYRKNVPYRLIPFVW